MGGGMYMIDSFFDVFTELSVDEGNSWYPAETGSDRISLVPEPLSCVLLGIGGLALLRRRK